MKKWYTCAPARFEAVPSFFSRDSGLLCRELKKMGCDSKVVLFGPAFPNDGPDIIRASREQMESPDWWKSLEIDGVIMVAWARHRDTAISRAIIAGGVSLVLHVDGTGSCYPLLHQIDSLKTLWRLERYTGRSLIFRFISFLKSAIVGGAALLINYTYFRYRHLQEATVVTYQTPTSLERNQQLCRFFGNRNHRANLNLAGYPVPHDFSWDPSIPKEKRIVAIGRWDDLRQKRPLILMAVCAEVARHHRDLQIDIFGFKTDALAQWHDSLDCDLQQRIRLHGIQPAVEISKVLKKAQITFFPSAGEGGPQALFEGLACGATTVGFDSPDLPGTRWAVQNKHGELAREDTVESYVDALERELAKWQSGQYSPRQISEFWKPYTQASEVIQSMIKAAAKASPAQASAKP